MIMDYHQIKPQINEMLNNYTGLREESIEETNVILSGAISINRSYNNFVVDNEYKLKIVIPLNNDKCPEIVDIGNHISQSYVHKYLDGRLCLETDAYVAYCFYKGYTLMQWMKNIVEPYYYSYEYYCQFDEFPFGERGHSFIGVIETYQQIFEEQDIFKILKLLSAISQRKYRGHLPCPCGSNIITRKCHGSFIMPFITDEQLHSIAYRDYMNIFEEIKNYDK